MKPLWERQEPHGLTVRVDPKEAASVLRARRTHPTISMGWLFKTHGTVTSYVLASPVGAVWLQLKTQVM